MRDRARELGWVGFGMVLALGLASLPSRANGDANDEHKELVRVLYELRDELRNIRGELGKLQDSTARGLGHLGDQAGRIDDAIRSCGGCRR